MTIERSIKLSNSLHWLPRTNLFLEEFSNSYRYQKYSLSSSLYCTNVRTPLNLSKFELLWRILIYYSHRGRGFLYAVLYDFSLIFQMYEHVLLWTCSWKENPGLRLAQHIYTYICIIYTLYVYINIMLSTSPLYSHWHLLSYVLLYIYMHT
jgi:hypothetical protein